MKNFLKANKNIIINLLMIVLVIILLFSLTKLIEVDKSKRSYENNTKKQVEQYKEQRLLQSTEKIASKAKQEENVVSAEREENTTSVKKEENVTTAEKAIRTNAIEEILERENREKITNNTKQEENVASAEKEENSNSAEQKENTMPVKKEENATSTENTTDTNAIKETIENKQNEKTTNEVKQEKNINSAENTVEASTIEEASESSEKTSVGYSTAVTPETMTIMGYEEIDVDKAITFIVELVGEDNIDKIKLNGASLNFHISNTNKAAKAENINAYFVLAQQLLETGIFTFKNSSVKPEYYNFAGLGATDKDPKPNKFFSNYEGQLAQVQHLKGYATTDALNEECKDQRFSLLTNKRGSAVNAAELSNKWALNSDYGKSLASIYNRFHNIEVNSEIVSKYKYKEF